MVLGWEGNEGSPRPLWSITAKNTDRSTGPLARPFARSLAPLTRSLAPDCSLRSRPPLHSLAHFTHSLARETVNDWMAILSVFFLFFDHSAFWKFFFGGTRIKDLSSRPQNPYGGYVLITCGLVCYVFKINF